MNGRIGTGCVIGKGGDADAPGMLVAIGGGGRHGGLAQFKHFFFLQGQKNERLQERNKEHVEKKVMMPDRRRLSATAEDIRNLPS